MARYRKVDTRIWNDAKFRELTDDGKLAFLFLMTNPHMTSLGAMRETIPGLASELGWEQKRFSKAFGEAFRKGMVKHDPEASFIWLPNFLKYNSPESPNVVRSWEAVVDLLPECSLLFQLLQQVKAFTEGLGEGFGKALPEAFRKGMPNPDPEPEPDLIPPIVPQAKSGQAQYSSDFISFWNAYPKAVGKGAAWKAWLNVKPRPDLADLLAAIEVQKQTPQWLKDNGQYIPNPATWLNQSRWEDRTQDQTRRRMPDKPVPVC